MALPQVTNKTMANRIFVIGVGRHRSDGSVPAAVFDNLISWAVSNTPGAAGAVTFGRPVIQSREVTVAAHSEPSGDSEYPNTLRLVVSDGSSRARIPVGDYSGSPPARINGQIIPSLGQQVPFIITVYKVVGTSNDSALLSSVATKMSDASSPVPIGPSSHGFRMFTSDARSLGFPDDPPIEIEEIRITGRRGGSGFVLLLLLLAGGAYIMMQKKPSSRAGERRVF